MQNTNNFFKTLLITIVGMAIIVWLFRGCWGNEKEHDSVKGSHEAYAEKIAETGVDTVAQKLDSATTAVVDTVAAKIDTAAAAVEPTH